MWSIDSNCYVSAAEGHNEAINKGWAYTIVGAITGCIALATYSEKFAKTKSAPKTKKH